MVHTFFFLYFREKLFTDQQICIVTELILSTHSFYLANYWNVIEETYNYFFKRVLQYTVMVITLIAYTSQFYIKPFMFSDYTSILGSTKMHRNIHTKSS